MRDINHLISEILEPISLDKNDYKCFKSKNFRLSMLLWDQVDLFVLKYNQKIRNKKNHISASDVMRLALTYFLDNIEPADIQIEPRSKHKFKE